MADFDFIVAGAGLAGACTALHLKRHGSVLVLEKDEPASGGSGASAGLVNPILGLRARPVWRIREALAALDETIEWSGAQDAYRRRPTLRPARDEEQIAHFERTAAESPEHAEWIPDHTPDWLRAPHGVLKIRTGGAIDIEALVRSMLRDVELRIGTAVDGWHEVGECVEVCGLTCRYLILALGRGYTSFPALMRLRLHQVKGQTVRLRRPQELPDDAPHLAGPGYVAAENGTVVCGSTYEHRFEHLDPTPRQTRAILRKVSRMLPPIRHAEVIEERAGVRVTVPGIRLPMVGPLPGCRRVWIFTGLGAKGLLTAPLIATEMAAYFEDPARIPSEIRVRSHCSAPDRGPAR